MAYTRAEQRRRWPRRSIWCLWLGLVLCALDPDAAAAAVPKQSAAYRELASTASRDGSVRVLVRLDVAARPEGSLASAAVANQRRALRDVQDRVEVAIPSLRLSAHRKRYAYTPWLAAEVDAATLARIAEHPSVIAIHKDRMLLPLLAESVPQIGADTISLPDHDGGSQAVAVLDTGVDASHPFLRDTNGVSRVVHEACFSSGRGGSLCPFGQSRQLGTGAAAPCGLNGCSHGTHVAGIVAGRGVSTTGVARAASILAIQVFSRSGSDIGAFDSDLLAALEHVYEQRGRFSIAAVNMSLGGGRFTSACDNEPLKQVIDLLRSVRIAVVVASGNDGFTDSISYPACISSTISVGATSDTSNQVAAFSNSAAFLDLLAPGQLIASSVPGGGFANQQGTSMAAPHVAGAIAVLQDAVPGVRVDQVEGALFNSGVNVTDGRNGVTHRRIRVDAAVATLANATAVNGLRVTPTSSPLLVGPAGGPFTPEPTDYTLTNASGTPVGFSVVAGANWVSASPSLGTLATGGSASVDVTLTAAAQLLPPGNHVANISFINDSTGIGNTTRAVRLNVQAPPAANDKFADAFVLTTSAGTTLASSNGATRETGEPAHAGNAGGASVWYTWTAPGDGTVTFDTAGSTFDTLLAAYVGNSVSTLTATASNDDAIGLQSRITFAASGGISYRIAVDGFNGASGDARLNWTFVPASTLGDLSVSPAIGLAASGGIGGPFSPTSITYTLGNTSATSIAYTVSGLPAWLTATNSTGTLAPGTSTTVIVSLTASAATLPAGTHRADVRFNDVVRSQQLTVSGASSSNDAFASSAILSSLPIAVTASNVSATLEVGEPRHAGVSGGHSLWWQFTATASDRIGIDTAGSNFDTTLAVYQGNSLETLIPVAANDDDNDDGSSRVSVNAVAGNTYFIAVDGFAGDAGNIVLNVRRTSNERPPNDDFATAETISGYFGTLQSSTLGATREAGEPVHVTSGAGSIWFAWTAPATGEVAFATFDSNFDTLLAAYAGNTLPTLSRIAENDDALGGPESRIRFRVEAGVRYAIAVDGFAGGSRGNGTVELFWNLIPGGSAISNDAFANAIALNGPLPLYTEGSNVGATAEAGEPAHTGHVAERSVWFRWMSPSTRQVAVHTRGSAIDTRLGVYSGDSVSLLTQVASNDNSPGNLASLVTFTAQAGVTYQIAVDGYENGGIAVAIVDATRADDHNDAFADMAPLTGTDGHLNASSANATGEAGEPAHAGAGGAASLWWRWRAPADGVLLVSTSHADFDTVLAVYTGTAVGTLTEVAANDDIDIDGDILQSEVFLPVTGGTDYRIAVDGFEGETGNVGLFWAFIAVEPELSVSPASGFTTRGNAGGPHAPASTTYTLANAGATPLQFAVTGLPRWLQAEPPQGAVPAAGSLVLTLRVDTAFAQSMPAGVDEANIRINDVTRPVAIEVLGSTLANDRFDSALPLPAVTPLSVRASNQSATAEPGEPDHGGFAGGRSVWWRWTPAISGNVNVNTFGSDFAATLAVYEGQSLGTLALRAADAGSAGLPAQVSVNIIAGHTYYIVVDGFGGDTGNVVLNVVSLDAIDIDILDVDGDGGVQALTDGLLILRHLFGFRGQALTDGAIGQGAIRNTPEAVDAFLAPLQNVLDVDGSSQTEALNDGLLLLRLLFGFDGDALTAGAVSSNAARRTAAEIRAYIEGLAN